MGNLVDTYVIRMKDEWSQKQHELNWNDFAEVAVPAVPEKYQEMLRILLKNHFMEEIMNNVTWREHWYEIMEPASNLETKDLRITSRYREESLMQVLRKTFYDTLLIIENDYDHNKENKFFVVLGDPISEEQLQNPTEDQIGVHNLGLSLAEKGYTTYTLDGKIFKPIEERRN
jgi:hypothetical protein